jgi:hypothetical protein
MRPDNQKVMGTDTAIIPKPNRNGAANSSSGPSSRNST